MINPEVQTTSKGFKIIPVTLGHILGWGGIGICDSCNSFMPSGGTYVGALNCVHCEACFKEWHTRAKYYKEDQPAEQRFIDRTLAYIKNS
jgi:hypothetical protein